MKISTDNVEGLGRMPDIWINPVNSLNATVGMLISSGIVSEEAIKVIQ